MVISPMSNISAENCVGETPLLVALRQNKHNFVHMLLTQKDKDSNTILHYAATGGDVETCKFCLADEQCNPNITDSLGNTPLHCAAAKSKSEVCVVLLASDRCNPNLRNKNGDAPVHLATWRSLMDIVLVLVNDKRHNPDLQCCDRNGNTALHIACATGNITLCDIFLQQCNPNIQNKFGNTPLHVATIHGNDDVVCTLIAHEHCDPSITNRHGNCPLHIAAIKRNVKLCSLIVSNQHNGLNIQNKVGKTPLHIAASNFDCTEILQILVLHKHCNPNIQDASGNTPLHIASSPTAPLLVALRQNKNKFVRMLLTQKNKDSNTTLHYAAASGDVEACKFCLANEQYNLNITDSLWNTPLHCAVAKSKSKVCVVLLASDRCNPNLRNKNGDAPVHLATWRSLKDIVLVLVNDKRYNPDLQCCDRNGNTALHIACATGNITLCDIFLQQCNPNVQNKFGNTPLHVATIHGNEDVVYALIAHKHCNPSITNRHGNCPLHIAAVKRNVKLCRLIVSHQHNGLNIQNKVGKTPLHIAASSFDCTEILQILVHHKCCNPNIQDASGNTPLHIASSPTAPYYAFSSNIKLCQLTLNNEKCDPNIQNAGGSTPLHIAARTQNLALVHLLFQNQQCNPNLVDRDGNTALHIAVENGNLDITNLLLNISRHSNSVENELEDVTRMERCNPYIANKSGDTILHVAATMGNTELCKLVLDRHKSDLFKASQFHGTQVTGSYHTANKEGDTPLHIAVLKDDTEVCDLLTSQLCDPNAQDKAGNTPLHYATWLQSKGLVEVLLNCQYCCPCIPNYNGSTPLHVAAEVEDVRLAELLLSHRDCDVNVQDRDGTTALHTAMANLSSTSSCLLVQTFLSHKLLNPNIQDCNGNTPLHLAVIKGNYTAFEHILKNQQTNPNIINNDHSSALHIGLSENSTDEFMEALINHSQCNLNLQDVNDNTGLHLAIEKCKSHIANMLINKKCDLTIPNSDGSTPLHIACIHASRDSGILKVARSLLSSATVDPSCVNSAGQTPVELTTNYQLIQDISHFTECKTKHSVQTYIKLFLLGNPSTGKSTLVKAIGSETSHLWRILPRILRRVKQVPAKTAGIIPTTFRSKVFGNTVLYDLAGQVEYYSSHAAVIESAVFSSPPAFLVVINLSESEAERSKQLKYWWSFINNHAAKASSPPHVILVGSHADLVGSKANEKLSHMYTISRRLSSSFNFAGQVALDCRDPVSRELEDLCSLVSKSCTALRTSADVDLHCHTLYAFLLEKFPDAVACTISDIATQIRDTDSLLPQHPSDLKQLLSTLSNRGLILLVENSERPEESRVILQKEKLLSEINGSIFAPESFSQHRHFSSTGIVHRSRLQQEFPQYDTNMVIEFLTSLEFCYQVNDTEVLPIINEEFSASNADGAYGSDDFYFFPGLVSVENRTSVLEENGSMQYKCAWHCESTNPDQSLTTRFLHVLILRLAFLFTLPAANQQHSSPVLCKCCSLWKRGIGWLNEDGIEVVVEVELQYPRITLLMRCPDDAKMKCVELRSTVIHEILQTRQKYCEAMTMTESFIHPTQIQYPVVTSDKLYLLTDISSAIVKKGKRVVDQHRKSTELIDELLYFEPYAGIGGELLEELFNEDNVCKIVSEGFLARFADQMDERMSLYREAIKPAKTAFEEAIKKEDIVTRQCLVLLRSLCHRTTPTTYQNFHKELDKFSIFCGRNPITGKFPSQ